MALIDWSDEYSVSVSQLDDQHKKLIGMINSLHQAMMDRRGKDAVQGILSDMSEYTVYHFSTEEKLMAKYGYASSLGHKTEHQKFMNKITEFLSEFESGKVTVTIDLLTFLKSWLTDHILVSDKKYVDFFQKNGIK